MFFGKKTDEALVRSAQQGDKRAIASLYDTYIQPIYRFCYWQTNSAPDAEDLTSQVFVEMIKSLHTFKGNSSFKNWLYSIAKHIIAEWIREKYRLPKAPLFDIGKDDGDWLSEDNGAKKEKTVHRMLSKLQEKPRQVLELRYLRGYSVAETAKALHLGESNVKVITKRSLERLAKICNYEDTL